MQPYGIYLGLTGIAVYDGFGVFVEAMVSAPQVRLGHLHEELLFGEELFINGWWASMFGWLPGIL